MFLLYFSFFIYDAGQLASMFCSESSQAWGMAPNKGIVQPEMLGFGAVKMQATGFLSLVIIKMDAAIAVFAANKDLQNDVINDSNGSQDRTPLLGDIQEMLRHLSPTQITTFTEAMGDGTIYKWTMGAGDTLIVPPGYMCSFSSLTQMQRIESKLGKSNRNTFSSKQYLCW